jgi:two-component system chemotaxis response regulator CheY
LKVLSVDDSKIIRKIIRGSVEVLGLEFLEAGDGVEALAILSEQHQDIGLILLDWNMPNLDGISTLRELKKDERFLGIPVMMVTTEGEKSNIVEAIKTGAKHYLIKPFTPEDLTSKMLECIGTTL